MAEQVLRRALGDARHPRRSRSPSRPGEQALLRLPTQAGCRVRGRGGRVRDPGAPGGLPRGAGAERERARVPDGHDGLAHRRLGQAGAGCPARAGRVPDLRRVGPERTLLRAERHGRVRRASRSSTRSWLRGRKGFQRYVVNSDGERIRDLGGQQPTPGGDLVLTIDSEWQRAAEGRLEDEHPPHETGPRRRQRHLLQGGRGRRDRARRRDRRAESDGVLARLRPAAGSCAGLKRDEVCYLGPQREVLRSRQGRPFAEPRVSGGLHPRLDLQAVHGARRGQGGLRGPRHALPLPVGVRPSRRRRRTRSSTNWSTQDLYPRNLAEHLIISCDTCFYEWGSDFWFRYQNDQLGEDNEPLQTHLRAWGFEQPTGSRPAGRGGGFLPDAEWGNAPEQKYLFGHGGWNPGGVHPHDDRLGVHVGHAPAARDSVRRRSRTKVTCAGLTSSIA